MDGLQFVASLMSSLAWPATIIVLVLILRDPISRVLLTLTKLKYRDVELDFGKELNELEQAAQQIDVHPKKANVIEGAPKESSQILSEAQTLAETFPRAAVSVAWSAVETEIMAVITQRAISPDYSFYSSPLKNIQILADSSLIDNLTLQVLDGMRKLRNAAVHAHPKDADITTDQAREFVFLARGIIDKLKALP